MTKIEEFEKELIENGIFAEDYAEYEKLLKRVHDNFNCLQHCYITALHFPPERSEQAIDLIEWGLSKYPTSWFPTYSAYCDMHCIIMRISNRTDYVEGTETSPVGYWEGINRIISAILLRSAKSLKQK